MWKLSLLDHRMELSMSLHLKADNGKYWGIVQRHSRQNIEAYYDSNLNKTHVLLYWKHNKLLTGLQYCILIAMISY